MGKLHQLRRAIEADPFAFYSGETGVPEPGDSAYGARRVKGRWKPAYGWDSPQRYSYRGFVKATLIELGYMMPGRSAKRILLRRERQRAREIMNSTIKSPPLFSSLYKVGHGQVMIAADTLKEHRRRS